ncbi:Rne/Rng family ribonuclease [Frigidibacter albus]|uniref:Ribonuclease E n=1 Tax=Frigidibacter albus TaxID=1465486 RepID=A0A6L8VCK8_9RHOB|nr:ribonuclease E/G [Frigidibacter albus]MZQ87993.1 Rne/Rng family ribonuclease [Frigidibacter albus]NBE30333.1 Rne/Rng family ribonuclease [Frigidibacter albus]GGH48199.1 ribonuclease E [Frigidibacter albus]
MAKKMLIDATHAEETRVVVVDGNKVEEFDFETLNRRQLAGNIYLAKVTRVEPSLQAAFVDYGGNRHGFLAFSEIHPDYYQIPLADRQALLAEERAFAEAQEAEDAARTRKRQTRSQPKAHSAPSDDAVTSGDDIGNMDIVDLSDDDEAPEDIGGDSAAEDAANARPAPQRSSRRRGGRGSSRAEAETEEDAENAAESEPEADEPYVAADHAAETDDEIESIAEEDVAEEIRSPRKPRPRRYKIQEVVKVRQILLVQVVKEERGNKGAALTTYLSLAGRYCVLMPNTARGGGISRKITNAADRKKLKEIAGEIEVPEGAGLIIRTAGSQRTKTEIRRDYEYLLRLWEQIRDLTLKSIAPAPIYEEGDLIKRSIRDLYSKEIDEVIVEGERGYRTAKDFMKMIMPTHAGAVKRYAEPQPLFARFQVEGYLSGMFNPVVQLKSGGYIVIGITEALVAIDVNSGRATKEGSIEETALKTNSEAAEEIARQLRLRDLAGLIVIDFIDMEERRNNATVEKKLKDKLKTDRARIQVGRISGFGLLEMSRQRLRPGMLESTTQPCAHCHGTGIIRSDDSLALSILRAIEEEGTRKRSREVLLRAPVAVVNFLMNQKREHVAQIEARYGMSVRVEADPSLVSPDFVVEKFKTAVRNVPESLLQVVSATDAALMADLDEEEVAVEAIEEEEAEVAVVAPVAAPAAPEAAAEGDGERGPKKKRRRRRKKKNGNGNGADAGTEAGSDQGDDEGEDDGDDAASDAVSATEAPESAMVVDAAAEPEAVAVDAEAEAPKKKTRTRKPRAKAGVALEAAAAAAAEAAATPEAAEPAAKPKRTRAPAKPRAKKVADAPVAETVAEAPVAEAGDAAGETRAPATPEADLAAAAELVEAMAPVTVPEPTPAEPEAAAEDGDKPKRRGWWAR